MSIRAAIVGPTGYTGEWLIELLLGHPGAAITYLASARSELPNIAEIFPRFQSRCEIQCRPVDHAAIADEADVVFLALPHRAAMEHAPGLLGAGLKVIDLSADYRLRNADQYESVYQTPHEDRSNLSRAVYGLPELFRGQIAHAALVANPGCYPTAAALAIAPLLRKGLVRTAGIVINAASGVTGAGRSPKANLQYAELDDSYCAYACGDHRHQPEIEQTLSDLGGEAVEALFVPHLLPVDRGILETIYLESADDQATEDDLFETFEQAYDDEPFVRVRAELPNIKHVRDTNFCDVTVRLVQRGGRRHVVVLAAIDNMIKGASGQAIQNMNLLFGQEETAGLR